MKKVLIFIALALLCSACSGGSPPENKTTGAANKAGNAAAKTGNGSNEPVDSTAAPPQNTAAARIDRQEEISFEPGQLPEGWRWIDPDDKFNPTAYDTKKGVLHIDVPTGKDLFGETRTAPQLLKTITGDFEIETQVKFAPTENYQGAGLLVFRNDSNYLRLERGFGGVGSEKGGIRFDVREDEAYEPITTPESFPTDAPAVDLRLRRAGMEFTAFWRLPGGEWKQVGKYSSSYPETVQVGLVACNTAEEIPVEFANLKLSPSVK
ncbi:MAG TPA: DUF1349 domain-containing protein [Pyrinomonadaceae bacterium]|jgi:regulation of enolase protein 1 (concanavalin A-like superfamily)